MKQMYVDLKGQVAVVTGGATGIGREISKNFARCGAKVIINFSKSYIEAEETVEEIKKNNGIATFFKADLTDKTQCHELFQFCKKNHKSINILVANHGGVSTNSLTTDLTTEEWDNDFDLNCKSIYFCVRYGSPLMPNGGRIIVTSSISAKTGGPPGALPYCAAKGAINTMIKNWATEFAPKGITVNGVSPGVIWTRIHERRTTNEKKQELISRIPLNRVGQPHDLVGAYLLLSSQEGAYMTGQLLEVNGGLLFP